ncbi:tektin-2 isoform X1 [Salmo salar]|uniref:Tektin n=2 Tax=Salmo salar TaxID=8030 RepID=A0A1S3M0W9_SALSA|nr:tektin-2 isoform X1 [Salmo salar]|eukprot:XP_013996837.1 PREDICTED: tektin-2 isoform X1 [Salmo salar]
MLHINISGEILVLTRMYSRERGRRMHSEHESVEHGSAKPGLRYSVSDWDTSNKQISDTAEHRRHMSHMTRQEGRALRNETTSKTNWDKSDSSRRLSDRIWDISRWRETLESCIQEVEKEMDALTLGKEETERALTATAVPLEVTVECLTLREGRRGNELVSDPVEAQLKKEVEMIDGAQRVFQQGIDKAFEQLCLLQVSRQQLTHDLQNKIEAQDIDLSCLSITVTSPKISLKPNPLRIPIGSTTPQQWEQFSQYNVDRAQEEMQASLQLREDMSVTRVQLQNELDAQRIATVFAIRKRTHHLEQARNETQWQMKSSQDEISDMERDIRSLEDDLQAKMAPLKLVHTRLENRTKRPGVDLCRDEVQYGLVDEANQLEATILALKQKLAQAQYALQALQLHQAHMEEDLSHKKDALFLEQRSLETRGRLASAAFTDVSSGAVVPLTNSSGRHNLELA